MKSLNSKIIFLSGCFLWIAVSFGFFANKILTQQEKKSAQVEINQSAHFLDQYSKDLKYKLGQWAYNYHLLKVKGVDFDQDAFLSSEFESLYFLKWDGSKYQPQWIKSKDLGSANLPEYIYKKQKTWTQTDLESKDLVWFTGKSPKAGPKVYFGFAVNDKLMGQGLILSSIDLDYLPLNKIGKNIFVLDQEGKYLFHKKREYIAQKALPSIIDFPDQSFEKTEAGSAWLAKKKDASLNLSFIYKNERTSVISSLFYPIAVMISGFMLLMGFFVFDIFTKSNADADFNGVSDRAVVNTDEFDSQGYSSVLKINELRERLNKMSLLSSSLKGRLDLAVMGNSDQRLLQDVQNDFEHMDKLIDEAFKSSQNLDSMYDEVSSAAPIQSLDLSHEIEKTNIQDDTVLDLNFTTNEDEKVQPKHFSELETENEERTSELGLSGLSFELSGSEIEAEELSFSPLVEIGSDEDDLRLSSFEIDKDVEQLIAKTNKNTMDKRSLIELDNSEGLVSEYLKTESKTNDWSKIIDELTEELNNIDLDLENKNAAEEEVSGTGDSSLQATQIKPPRVEI